MSTVPAIPARFADPPDSPTPQRIVSKWELFLGSIATGVLIDQAMLDCFIKRKEIQAMLNTGPLERKRYQDAKLAGLRQAYSEFDLDELFNRIAMGTTVGDSFMQVFGVAIPATFYEILRSDPEMEERYQTALKTKAVIEMEKSLEIIDDDSKDIISGPKGDMPNMAAVNRSKLRFEGRHRLAGNWYRRLYGEKETKVDVNVQVNYAERIEQGLIRARDRRATPRAAQPILEGEFHQHPAPEPVEEKSTSTDWMEDK